MNTDFAIRGSLASLPESFSEAAFIQALGSYGLTFDDSRLLLERAFLDAYVTRVEGGTLRKLARALESAEDPSASEDAA